MTTSNNNVNVNVNPETAQVLEPVMDKPQTTYVIKDKPFSEIQKKVQECLEEVSDPENLNTLLQIRSQLVSQFKPVNSVIEKIEKEVKEANLEEGEYGFLSTLVVSYAKKNYIDDQAVFALLKKEKLNPLEYAKLDTTSNKVKSLLLLNPQVTTTDPKGTKRHSFK